MIGQITDKVCVCCRAKLKVRKGNKYCRECGIYIRDTIHKGIGQMRAGIKKLTEEME